MSLLLIATLASGCATLIKPGGDLDTYMKIRWPGSASLDTDGSVYFVDHPDGISQLYRVAPGDSMADAVKLTHFEDGIGGYSISPDGKWIAITASVGGSEQSDLFLMNSATAEMKTLYGDPKVVFSGAVWSRDSKSFAFSANDESPSDFHVYLHDIDSQKREKMLAAPGYNWAADMTRDGKKLVILRFNSASYTQIFEMDAATKEMRELTPAGEEWYFAPVGYSIDEKSLLVSTNYKADLRSVRSIDLSTGEIRKVLPRLDGFEIDAAGFNVDRSILAVVTNEDGYGTLHLYDSQSFVERTAPPMDKGVVSNLSFQDPYLLYSQNNANTPGVVYKWNYETPEVAGVAVTKAETFGVDVSKFLLPELVRYESFDGEKIPAFLYLPSDYKQGQKIPFLVHYHGGPESQSRPTFARSYQYFLSRGFGLLVPNIRGSSGYGKAYLEADNYKNRHKSVKDGIWAAKYLIRKGYSKPQMIGAWGGSYGGFMVMAMLTEAPQLFGAGCNVVGIVNFQTFLEQTADYRRHLRESEYGPLDDPEFLKSISPIYKVDKIEAPLMIAHGLNDPRVPVGEAMQIAVALKKRGLPVEELYFPDEGHGFAKEENRLLYYRQMVEFFEKHLGKK